MKKKWLLILAMAGILALTGGCGSKEESAETEGFSSGKLVKLGNYKNVEIEAIASGLTDADIQYMIDGLLEANAEAVPLDKTVVELGDTVNIDYAGYKDGVAFDGGTAEGHNLTIGSGRFIDGFEDGLIGAEVGGTYDLDLTFPENYGNAELAGQDVVFTVTVNQIVELVKPEWTDEFVKENTSYASIDEYVEGTKAIWESYMAEQSAMAKKESVLNAIIADSEFDCDKEIQMLEESMRTQYEDMAVSNEMELEEFLMSNYGVTEEEFDVQLKEMAEYEMKAPLVINAIIEEEKITITEEEYQEGLQALAGAYAAESPEAFEEQYGRELIENNLIYEKAVAFVVDQAVEK